jgi:hypothetical protein
VPGQNTTGIVEVAALAARRVTLPPVAATLTVGRTESAASPSAVWVVGPPEFELLFSADCDLEGLRTERLPISTTPSASRPGWRI